MPLQKIFVLKKFNYYFIPSTNIKLKNKNHFFKHSFYDLFNKLDKIIEISLNIILYYIQILLIFTLEKIFSFIINLLSYK